MTIARRLAFPAIEFYLPDFQLLLINRAGGATVATTQTDLFGRYRFTRVPGGDYQVCWRNPGWIPGCVDQKITVDRNIVVVAKTEARPEIRQQPDGSTIGAYWGRVSLADGSSPWFADDFFGITRTAVIQANVVGGATVANTVANVSGEYVVVGVSSAAPLQPRRGLMRCAPTWSVRKPACLPAAGSI